MFLWWLSFFYNVFLYFLIIRKPSNFKCCFYATMSNRWPVLAYRYILSFKQYWGKQVNSTINCHKLISFSKLIKVLVEGERRGIVCIFGQAVIQTRSNSCNCLDTHIILWNSQSKWLSWPYHNAVFEYLKFSLKNTPTDYIRSNIRLKLINIVQ